MGDVSLRPPEPESIGSVMSRLFAEASKSNELLTEIILQVKLFNLMVTTATYDGNLSVTLERPEIHDPGFEMWGKRIPPVWRPPSFDPTDPFRDVTIEFDVSMRNHHMFVEMNTLREALGNSGGMSMSSSAEVSFDSGYHDPELKSTFRFYPHFKGNDSTVRMCSMTMLMFNHSQETQEKVEYLAKSDIVPKTELEIELKQLCKSLAAFYQMQMNNPFSNWRRDPFSKPKQSQDQIEYEPRLGRF